MTEFTESDSQELASLEREMRNTNPDPKVWPDHYYLNETKQTRARELYARKEGTPAGVTVKISDTAQKRIDAITSKAGWAKNQKNMDEVMRLSGSLPEPSGRDGMGQRANTNVDYSQDRKAVAMDNVAKLMKEAGDIAVDLNIDRRAAAGIVRYIEDIGAASEDPENLDDTFRALGPTAVNFAINMLNGRFEELKPVMQHQYPREYAALNAWLLDKKVNEPAVYSAICDIIDPRVEWSR